jgi:hypothetical protein
MSVTARPLPNGEAEILFPPIFQWLAAARRTRGAKWAAIQKLQ